MQVMFREGQFGRRRDLLAEIDPGHSKCSWSRLRVSWRKNENEELVRSSQVIYDCLIGDPTLFQRARQQGRMGGGSATPRRLAAAHEGLEL